MRNKLTKWHIEAFAQFSDAQLSEQFDRIGTRADDRVKATGHVKIKAARRGDLILDELKRRKG